MLLVAVLSRVVAEEGFSKHLDWKPAVAPGFEQKAV